MKILICLFALLGSIGCTSAPGSLGFKIEVSVPTGQGKVDLNAISLGKTNAVATP